MYGRYPQEINVDGNDLVIGQKRIPVLAEKDPAQLPWEKLGVDVVFECTGLLKETGDMEKHIQAGARYAILSAPSESEDMTTVVHGTSMIDERPTVYSCASCTTNCITAVAEVIQRRIGVKKAVMTVVHAYTSTQEIVDGPSKKTRRGRAAAANLIPTTTGAAISTTKVLPELTDLFDGVAIRAHKNRSASCSFCLSGATCVFSQ